MLASILLAACIVPERLHLTGIASGSAHTPAIARRLKHESFDAVVKSLPRDDPTVGFADRGWMTREELKSVGHPAGALTKAGATVAVDADTPIAWFVHVVEIRPAAPCDASIARYPRDVTARLVRAESRRAGGDLRGAEADYSAVVRLDAKSYSAHYGLASLHYAARNYARALDDVDAALAGDRVGSGAEAYALKGMIEEARGDDDLATADEAYAIAQYHGRMQDESQARYALGMAYAHLGYFEAAIDEFGAALEKHPTFSYPYISRAFAWFSRGDVAKAKSDLMTATQSEPKIAGAYIDLAMLSYATGDAPGAFEAARQATVLDPHDPYAALWMLLTSRALHRAPPLANADRFAGQREWPAPAIRVFLDRAPVDSLEAAAASPDALTARMQLCEARFYGGAYRLAGGDRTGALDALRQAVRDCPYREHERAAAQQMVRALP